MLILFMLWLIVNMRYTRLFAEDDLAENERLKQRLTCMQCHVNHVNALLLPCTHLRLCIDCATSLDVCPVCNRHIDQKIRTFMG